MFQKRKGLKLASKVRAEHESANLSFRELATEWQCLTNQTNRRDEGRAAGPPRSTRVEREVRPQFVGPR